MVMFLGHGLLALVAASALIILSDSLLRGMTVYRKLTADLRSGRNAVAPAHHTIAKNRLPCRTVAKTRLVNKGHDARAVSSPPPLAVAA